MLSEIGCSSSILVFSPSMDIYESTWNRSAWTRSSNLFGSKSKERQKRVLESNRIGKLPKRHPRSRHGVDGRLIIRIFQTQTHTQLKNHPTPNGVSIYWAFLFTYLAMAPVQVRATFFVPSATWPWPGAAAARPWERPVFGNAQ